MACWKDNHNFLTEGFITELASILHHIAEKRLTL